MIEISETESKEIQTRSLEHKYPQIKKLINEDEALLAVSKRKPLYVPGLFCVFIGLIFLWQISEYWLISNPLWAIPAFLLSLMLIWLGVWFSVLVNKECVFVTDSRVARQRVNILGRSTKRLFSIPLSEITSVHLFKKTFVRLSNNGIGDILIKSGFRSYLLPTTYEGSILSETLILELQRNKAHQTVTTTSS